MNRLILAFVLLVGCGGSVDNNAAPAAALSTGGTPALDAAVASTGGSMSIGGANSTGGTTDRGEVVGSCSDMPVQPETVIIYRSWHWDGGGPTPDEIATLVSHCTAHGGVWKYGDGWDAE